MIKCDGTVRFISFGFTIQTEYNAAKHYKAHSKGVLF